MMKRTATTTRWQQDDNNNDKVMMIWDFASALKEDNNTELLVMWEEIEALGEGAEANTKKIKNTKNKDWWQNWIQQLDISTPIYQFKFVLMTRIKLNDTIVSKSILETLKSVQNWLFNGNLKKNKGASNTTTALSIRKVFGPFFAT